MRFRLCIFIISMAHLATAQEDTIVRAFEHDQIKQYPNVRDFTISIEGDEAYFSAQSPLGELSVIMQIKYKGGAWQSPEIVKFSGRYMDLEPFLSNDGLKLYFASDRPTDQENVDAKDFDIWYVQRRSKEEVWSEPVNLGPPINTEYNEFYPSMSINQNMYFTSNPPDSKGKDDIYFSAWEDSTYTSPVSLSDSINTDGYEFNAFVAPDESFLIFSGYNREDGQGSGDLYISYQKADSSWSNAMNLGFEINSGHMDYCPFVNMKTGTLYFTSRRSNLGMTRRRFESAQDFLNEITGDENGLSKIYQVDFSGFLSTEKNQF